MNSVRILLDNCVWSGVSRDLKSVGYDVVWVGDFAKDPGDLHIIRMANQQSRILITLDKDFGELAVFRGEPHKGIVRVVDHSVVELGSVCKSILEKYQNELLNSAIITVDKRKTRIRLRE